MLWAHRTDTAWLGGYQGADRVHNGFGVCRAKNGGVACPNCGDSQADADCDVGGFYTDADASHWLTPADAPAVPDCTSEGVSCMPDFFEIPCDASAPRTIHGLAPHTDYRLLAIAWPTLVEGRTDQGIVPSEINDTVTFTTGPVSCANGLDDDGDGAIDTSDSGCSGPGDDSERSDTLPCDDGLDNDGDGRVDYSPVPGTGDPGCYDSDSPLENPQCQDGINNDPGQDTLIDFDGGAAAGLPPAEQTAPDRQCMSSAWRDREAAPPASAGCGIGPELTLLGLWLAARRGRSGGRSLRPGDR
jgi:hypothetical protein